MSAHAGMNRFFRLVWSDTLCAWVAVAENARGKGKRSARGAAVLTIEALALSLSLPTFAGPPTPTQLPTGGVVSAGRAAISTSPANGAVLNIDQSTQRAAINWDTFNLGAAAQVNFNQPNSSASTLNRVLDSNPSQILGKITAPGQVVLSNPNGVMFGKSASVDVGGLTATTHSISDADFMAGDQAKSSTYTRNGATGKVVNEGELRAALNGYIALLAPEVRNEGVIVARLGTVALAAGEAITLNFSGNHTLAGITVQPSAIKALVENRGAVLAPGGLIVLSARALDRLQGGVVKNSGLLEATGLAMKGGRIVLEASERIENTGRISANAGSEGTASPAGNVTLSAPEIVNSGSITATGALSSVTANAQARAVAAATAGGSISLSAGTITQKAGGLLDVSGASGGSLKLRATLNLILDGNFSAVASQGHGGEITLIAGRDATLNNAVVDASGAARGGHIHVEAGSTDVAVDAETPALPSLPEAPDHHPTAALLGSAQLRTSSRRGSGGSVALTGDHVDLLDHTAIDASGASGGGEVLVGGGWQGSGPLHQATQVTQAETSRIAASATEQGSGGTIVLWSDIHSADSQTRVHGSLLAEGAGSGDGGRIETSGHWLDVEGAQALAAAGKAATGASAGKAGQWLLDPYDVAISTSANSNITAFSATGTPSNIQASTITTALNGGTSVTVTTGTSGTTDRGDINVNATIDKTSGATDVTLTLRAANSIVVNNSITHSGGSGKLNLVLDADNDAGTHDGAGVVILNANLSTGGGSLQFGTGATIAINSVTTKVGGDVYVGGGSAQSITTAGGAVTVNGEMLLANPSGLTIATAGGNVTFAGLLNAGDSYTNITSSNISWTSAYAAAKGATAGGSAVGDTYLATITSRLENAVASRAASYTTAWLGARRGNTTATATTVATSDNYWRWVTGPQGNQEGGNGLRFWLGATSPGAAYNVGYANWNGGEPNNIPASGGTNESAIQFTGAYGRWNDLDPALPGGGLGVNTYLRELNLAASPLSISAGAGTVTFTAMVGGLKALASLNVTAATVAINGGGVTTEGLQTYNGAVTLGSATTVLTQTMANTDFTLGANRSITNATGANATLTIKTTGGIVLAAGSSITSATGSLTPVLNADSDATGGGYIWMQQAAGSGATINSNGGAITLSGGADVTTGFAEGRAGIIGNGVTLDAATLNSNGGNIVIRGKSATSGTAYASSDYASSNNTDGVRLHGGNLINAGTGSITMQGVARGTDGTSSNGIETNYTGHTRLLSSATGTTAINLYGDATGGTSTNGWGTFLWGTNSAGILLAATGSNGGVTLNGGGRNTSTGGGTHLEPNTYVLAARGPISLTGSKGSASNYEDVVVNGTVGFAASLASGWGIASPVTASSSAITIAADTLSANRVFGNGSFTGSAVQSSGTLTLTPRTAGRALAVQTADPGASIAWIKPTSMFGAAGLFKTGFGKVVFGSATTGTVTLDDYSFDNDTDLNSGGNAVLGFAGIATKTLTVNITGSGSITDTGNVAVSKLALLGSTSAVTLDSAGNAIGTVAANVSSMALTNGSALSIGSVGSTNGVTATGTIDIATMTGDLTVAQSVVTTNTGTSAVRLNAGKSAAAGTASGGNLVLSGSPAITVGSGGRATLFSGSVAGSTGVTTKLGPASGRFRYTSDETSTNYSTALGSGLYAVYREQPLLTVTASAAGRSYDGTAYSGGNGASSPSGYVNGDTAAMLTGALTYGGSAQGATNAGTYAITPGGYGNGLGYGFNYVSGALTVNPRAVSFTGTRTYDAGTTIAGPALTVANAVGSDVVGADGSGTLSGKAAGTRTISDFGSIALSGAEAGNYTLSGATGSVTITPANLGVSGVAAASRAYDATSVATLVGTATVAPLGNDVASLSGTATASFANKNVGTAKPVTVSGYTLAGADASNYNIVQPTGLSATVSPANATITGVSATSRSYDGTTTIGLTGSPAVAHLGSDELSVSGSGVASVADKNAGSGKPVSVSGFTLAGTDAGNYTVVQPTGLTATIAPAAITLSSATVSKSYDGGTSASGSASVSAGTLFSGDTLSGGSYAFTNKNAGSGNKTVTVSGITVGDGNGGANYSVSYASNTTSTITPAALTVTAATASKTYDGNTNADGNASVGSLAGAGAGEIVGTAAQLRFTDKNAGSGKIVRASGLAIRDSGGADVTANYAVSYVDDTTGNIAQAALTVTANADARFVSQSDGAGFNGAHYSGLVGGETTSVLSGTLTITRPNAGTDVAAGSYGGALVPSGLSSGNYSISYAPGTYTILPANRLLVRIGNTSATYGSDPSFNVTSAEYLDADNTTIRALTGGGSGTSYSFNDGAGGSVSFTLGVLGNVTSTAGKTAVGNYAVGDNSPGIVGNNFTTLNFVGNLAVTQKTVTASASGVSKVYDGSTAMTSFTLGLTGKLTGDVLTASGSGSFSQKQAGSNIGYSVAGVSLSGTDGGNYYLSGGNSFSGSDGTITARPISVTGVSALGKTYDATTTAALGGSAAITRIGSDDITLVGTGVGSFADKNAGTGKAVTVTGFALTGADAVNYSIVQPTGLTADIAAATLAVTGVSAVGKTYDATRSAALTGSAAIARLGSDDVTLTGTAAASFADKNAGTGKAVAVGGFTLRGADAANYHLLMPAGLSADIAPAPLAVTGIAAADKVYDGSSAAALAGNATVTPLGGDAVALVGAAHAVLAGKNVAANQAVTVGGFSLTGADAGNYTLAQPAGLSASITPRTLNVVYGGVDKAYDGSTAATVTTNDDRIADDALILTQSAAFADKNAGSGKTVTVSGITLAGADAGNYSIAASGSGAASITPRTLIVGYSGVGKVYDGTSTAAVTTSDNRIAGDTLDIAHSASFADKNAANGKTIAITGVTLAGGDAANYRLDSNSGTAAASIAPRPVSVSFTNVDKVYDGTANAVLASGTPEFAGLVAGDHLGASAAQASYSDKNAGSGKTVTIVGLSLFGSDAHNYTLVNDGSTGTGSIGAATLLVSASAAGKVYDGTTAASATLIDDRAAGDALTLNYVSAAFADKSAGSGKAVTINGITVGGADAGNYKVLANGATAMADIAKATLTVTASGADKVYDAGTGAHVNLGDNRFGNDQLTLGYDTASFADKNAGIGKTVAVSGISLGGADAGNYSFNSSASTTADVAKAPLTFTVTTLPRTYDGSTAAQVHIDDNRLAGDTLSVGYSTANFADKNAGSGKTVKVGGIQLSGADAANYSVTATASSVGSIAPATLVVNAVTQTKPFDGSTQAVVTLTDNRLAGDDLSLAHGAAAFADTNIGSGKTVTVGGVQIAGGADQGNYVLASSSITGMGSIDKAAPRADTASLQPKTPAMALPMLDLNAPVGASAGLSLAAAVAAPSVAGPAASPAETAAPSSVLRIDGSTGATARFGTGVTAGVASLPVKLPSETSATRAAGNSAAAAPPKPSANPAGGGDQTIAVASGSTTLTVKFAPVATPADALGEITVSLVRAATAQQAGVVTVSVPSSIVSKGKDFSFPLPSNVSDAVGTREVRLTLSNGDRLPSWLRYVPGTLSFAVTAAPPGALPVQVIVRSGRQRWSVVVTERAGV